MSALGTFTAGCPRCPRTRHDHRYREVLTLRDGREVLLRPLLHRDAPSLGHFLLASLSDRSRLLRFHGVVNHFSDATLRILTTQSPGRHVALTAEACTDDGLPLLLAEARYAVEEGRAAEFAVSVADAWQRQGLGQALLRRLAAHARASGIGQLIGTVMPENAAMLGLAQGLGADLEAQPGEVMARLPLHGF